MGVKKRNFEFLVEGRFLFGKLLLAAVGILDGDALQMRFQIAAEGGDVFFPESGALSLFFCGQLPLLCQLCQLADPVDFFLINN